MTSAVVPLVARGIALVVVASLVIQLTLLITGGANANSGRTGETGRPAVAAVLLPNLIVMLDALLGIIITGLVYAIVLAQNRSPLTA